MSNYSLRNAAISTGRYLKLFGFATFSCRDDKVYGTSTGLKLKATNVIGQIVSVFDFSCLCFNLTIGFIVFFLSLSYGFDRLSQYSILLAVGVVLTMVSGSLVTILSILIVFFNRYRIWDIIKLLDNVMTKFKKINITPNFARHFILFAVFACIAILCIIIGLVWMSVFLGYTSKIGLLIVYGYLSISFGASMGWSSMFHIAIYTRLRLINVIIRDSFLTKLTEGNLPSLAQRESTILLVKSIHHDLMRSVQMVNIAFGFQTMLCFGTTFLFTLFTSFASYKVFFYQDTAMSVSVSSIYWCVFYNCFQSCIIFTCNLVDSEAEVLASLIYKMTNRQTCSTNTLEAFGNQVQQISGKSSCGLFHFDYSLIMMIFSSSVTYFIILIQFENIFQNT